MSTLPKRITLAELFFAYEFMNSTVYVDHCALIDPDRGEIYLLADDLPRKGIPDDIETSDRYILAPNKREIDLGRELVLTFAEEYLPDDYHTIADFFRHKGAYGRFKDFLRSRDMLKQWQDFENSETDKALRRWCEDNGIELAD